MLPLKVKVPEPDLVTATDVAEPFSITPLNEVELLSAPIVIVSVPDAELVTVPAPEREPIVSEKPLRSNVPVRLTADEFEMTSAAPNLIVPAETVVAPV